MGHVLTVAVFVRPEGKAWAGLRGVHDDAMLPGLAGLAEELRGCGRGVGRTTAPRRGAADPVVSGRTPEALWDDEGTGARALPTDEVRRVVDDFVAAAAASSGPGSTAAGCTGPTVT